MKEQTAVEFLIDELYMLSLHCDVMEGDQFMEVRKKIFEKALEMEKLQIVEAHGSKLKLSRGTSNYEYWYTGMEYYNEKFNNLKSIENE